MSLHTGLKLAGVTASIGLFGCSSAPRELTEVAVQQCQPISSSFVPDQATPSTFDECGAFLTPHDPSPLVYESPSGWASVSDHGLTGTTGGRDGTLVLARTAAELVAFGERTDPLIIEVCGVIGTGIEEIKVGSNQTLIGVGSQPTLRANLDLDEVANVIIRNLFIEGADPDGIAMRRSHHVWVDHVDISDAADGNLDVTDQSNYVTISFSRFWYRNSGQPHRFSNLIGSGDDNLEDIGHLKVTLHHNWWAENVRERMPRTRFGDIHVYNNYYTSIGNNYCVEAGYNAHLLVENNFFNSVGDPLVHSANGNILERDNSYFRTVGGRASTGIGFEPPYAYEPNAACDVPARVAESAGARLTP